MTPTSRVTWRSTSREASTDGSFHSRGFSEFPDGHVGARYSRTGGLCALASAFMPVPGEQSGKVYKAVYTVVNWIGCNFGKATNADDAAKKKV